MTSYQQDALLEQPAMMSQQTDLEVLARKKIDYLRRRGIVSEANELEAALLVDLTKTYSLSKAGYVKAQMARSVLDGIAELLPQNSESDIWQSITETAKALEDSGDFGTSPTYATKVDKTAPHQLNEIRYVAALLGKPLMPWQCYAARIMSQRTHDGTRWRYPVVVITVPRQSGKTTLMRAVLTQRAITRDGSRIFMTAQTGKDAAERWRDIITDISKTPLADYTDLKMSQGRQVLTFTPNESFIRPFSPKPEALHGYTATDILIDEAFSFDDAQGSDLMGGTSPTMATIDDSQMIIISTAGNPESTWLKSWVDKGREAISNPDAKIAYLEWSSSTDDPYSPDAIDFHPALGRTISRVKLLGEIENNPPSEWRRAYLNQWVQGSSPWRCTDPSR